MPLTIPNTTTQDTYVPALTFAGQDVLSSGFFTVANNSVGCRLIHGARGQTREGAEMFLPPGTYPVVGTPQDPIAGIKFRSFTAGAPAQVFGSFFYPNEASLQASSQFTTFVSAAGVVTQVTVPTGAILPFGGPTAPVGFVLADGSLYDGTQTAYQALWQVYGNTFGGTGQNNFAVPDLRGRTIVGVGTHADVVSRGASDGLAVASRRPKHKTSVSDPTHSHGVRAGTAGVQQLTYIANAGTDQNNWNSTTTSVSTGITAGPQTGAEPVDTPAYLVLQYIVAL